MAAIQSTQQEFATRIRNRMEELESTFATMIRDALRKNDLDIQVRIERAKKSVAEKGRELQARLDEAPAEETEDWPEVRERVHRAWVDYREAVDRARLELERESELS